MGPRCPKYHLSHRLCFTIGDPKAWVGQLPCSSLVVHPSMFWHILDAGHTVENGAGAPHPSTPRAPILEGDEKGRW